jgi:hypothetical protein
MSPVHVELISTLLRPFTKMKSELQETLTAAFKEKSSPDIEPVVLLKLGAEQKMAGNESNLWMLAYLADK